MTTDIAGKQPNEPTKNSEAKTMYQIQNQIIPLKELDPSPTNPRKKFKQAEIEDLGRSFINHTIPDKGVHGVKQSLLVRELANGRKEIIAGERRFRGALWAIENAPSDEIREILSGLPCRVEQLTDRQVLEIQLVENVQREDLTPVEEANSYQMLLELKDEDGTPSYTVEKIAQQVGRKVASIYEKLKILKAGQRALEALEAGILSERHCVYLARVPEPALREKAAAEIIQGKEELGPDGEKVRVALTVNEAREWLREHYFASLKRVPWKLEDAALLPEAGPCIGCKHLAAEVLKGTGELADMKNEKGKGETKGKSGGVDPLTCCNPSCRDEKLRVFFNQRAQQTKAAGGKVLTAREVKEVFYPHGGVQHGCNYVPLDSKPGYDVTGRWDDKRTPTYGELKKDAKADIPVAIALSPKGEIVELIDKKAAVGLAQKLKSGGGLKQDKKTLSAAEVKAKKAEALRNKITAKTRVLALSMLFEWVSERGVGIDEQMGHIKLALWHAGMDGCRLVAEWLDCAPEKKKGQLMHDDYTRAILAHLAGRGYALQQLQAVEAVIRVAKEVKQWGWAPECYKILAAAHGFDLKRVDARAKSDVEAIENAKDAKKAVKEGRGEKKPPSVSKSAAAARSAKVNGADETARDKISKGRLSGSETGGQGDGGKTGLVAAADKAVPKNVVSIQDFAKEIGLTEFAAMSKEDQAAAIAEGVATYVDCLGATPKLKAPERAEYDKRRVALHKAVKKIKGGKK
jgi:ParB/RepB/Spo0J family partition protein